MCKDISTWFNLPYYNHIPHLPRKSTSSRRGPNGTSNHHLSQPDHTEVAFCPRMSTCHAHVWGMYWYPHDTIMIWKWNEMDTYFFNPFQSSMLISYMLHMVPIQNLSWMRNLERPTTEVGKMLNPRCPRWIWEACGKSCFQFQLSPLSRFLRSKRQAAILAILEVVKKMKDWSSRGLDPWLMAGRLAIL